MRNSVKTNRVKSLFSAVKKPFAWISRKTEPARQFMAQGRAGAMILETAIGVQFFGALVYELFTGNVPAVLCFLIAAALFVVMAELLRLVFSVVFGKIRRSRMYFLSAFLVVMTVNLISTQAGEVLGGLLMTYALVLSADLLGRSVWGLVRTRRFRQACAYLLAGVSVAYLIFFGIFYHTDSFGESRVEFYNAIEGARTETAAGFSDYLKNGSHPVGSLSYGPDGDIVTETIDLTGFTNATAASNPFTNITRAVSQYDFAKAPVKGQIWYPEGKENSPVFFMVHGNHSAKDPSYLGYDYLGEYLASNGYVVVSVDENIINALDASNDLRAYLLLENMRVILGLNEQPGNALSGTIDADRVAIGGHSRGGEMAPVAYRFNELDAYPEDGNIRFDYHFNITSIVAISPVVDQYKPVKRSVEISDVNYLLLHGSNDQDVSTMMGEKQYHNVSFTNGTDAFYRKASVYILGANHGQFNTLWGRYDTPVGTGYLNTHHFIDEKDQQLIAKAYIRTFLDTTLMGEETYQSLLSDITPFEGDFPDTVYITNYEDSETTVLCSFEDTVDIRNYADGVSVDVTGADHWTLAPYERGSGGENENYVLSLSWEEKSEPCVTVTFPAADISAGSVSFSVADMKEGTEAKASALNYTVRLTDAAGKKTEAAAPVTVYPSLAVQLWKQNVLFGSYQYKHQLQTVRLTPSMFDAADFDFTQVVQMEIVTDGSEAGELVIDDISVRMK